MCVSWIRYRQTCNEEVPVAASIAIVSSAKLRPVPHGQVCGPTVTNNYLNNQEADRKNYFELTLPLGNSNQFQRGKFLLTGDVGVTDKKGFLFLKRRNKDLIKKGGEQVSPFEIEEPVIDHPWIVDPLMESTGVKGKKLILSVRFY